MPAKAKLTTRERTTSNVAADNLNKGSELSFAEADSNFFNLRDQTFAISDGATTTDIEAGETITFSGASVSGNTVSITGGGGSGDLGNLQVNNTTLEPITTNNNLILNANGTGNVQIEGAIFETDPSTSPSFSGTGISGGSIASRIEFNDNGTLLHRAGSAFNALSQSGYDLNLYTNAKVRAINATGFVVGNTNIDVEIASRSGGSLTLKTGEGDNPDVSGFIKIQDGADQNITITPNGTGQIVLDGLNWPTSDGTNGQFLITDGAGNLSFSSTSITTFGDLSAVGSTITAPSNADLTLATSGTGDLVSAGNHRVTGDLEVDVIRPEAAGNDIHILGLDVDVINRSYVKVEGGATAGVWIKGAAEISFDTSDTIGSGNSLHIGELFTRFNKGGNDTQNIMFHANQYPNNTHGLLHIETYADRGTTNGVGMVTINDSGIAYNGSSLKYEGQGTEVFNVFGTARLDNVFFKDNKIYTNQSNEDLELECSGTGTIDLKLPTSSTIGSNGGASALTANPVGYVKIKINGTAYQIPYYNV